MPINATFHGFVETTTDSLLLFEACRRGILPKISRRLQERERGSVKSGTVFIFDEKESGIKRWTDGLIWSPSRILGNFLVYRELGGRGTIHERDSYQQNEFNQYAPYGQQFSSTYMSQQQHQQHLLCQESYEQEEEYDENMTLEERTRDRDLVGSLTDTYKFRKGGLIKKTLSIHLNGHTQHMISYYTKEDVLQSRLSTPSSISEISCLQISPDLLLKQSFRVPPSVEFAEFMLKRPSLSPPSSTISSSTTSSINTSTGYRHYNNKRLPTNNNKTVNFHPYAPSIHQNQQQQHHVENDNHSIYHPRRLLFDAPSVKCRKLSRPVLDSSNNADGGNISRCSSSFTSSCCNHHHSDNNPQHSKDSSSYHSGICSSNIAAYDSLGSNEIYSSRYYKYGDRRGEIVNSSTQNSNSFRAVSSSVPHNNNTNSNGPLISPISHAYNHSSSSGSSNDTNFYYQDLNTPHPSIPNTRNNNVVVAAAAINSNKSAFMTPPLANNYYNDHHRELNQQLQQEQTRRHSHVDSPISLSSNSSPPSRTTHRHNSCPTSAPLPISSNHHQQRLHEVVPAISVLSSPPSSCHHYEEQDETPSPPFLSPSRFLWSNDTYQHGQQCSTTTYQGQQNTMYQGQQNNSRQPSLTSISNTSSASNIPTTPLHTSPSFPPAAISNSTSRINNNNKHQHYGSSTAILPYNADELPLSAGNDPTSRFYYGNNSRSTTITSTHSSSSAFINLAGDQQQQQQQPPQQQQYYHRYDNISTTYNNDNASSVLNSSSVNNNPATTRF